MYRPSTPPPFIAAEHPKVYAHASPTYVMADMFPDLGLPHAPALPAAAVAVAEPLPAPAPAPVAELPMRASAPTPVAEPQPAPGDVKRKSAMKVRQLQRNARTIAEGEYDAAPRRKLEAPTKCQTEIKKRMRNRSAFISRQSGRHYERLLVDLVQSGEQQVRDQAQEVAQAARDVSNLRAAVAALEGELVVATAAAAACTQPMGPPISHGFDVDSLFDDAALGFISPGVY